MERSQAYKTAERLIPESQLREAVREILTEMLGLNATAQSQKQWYDTDPAYSLLDLDSTEQLRVMVRDGIFRVGIEVRDIRSTGSQVPRYQFDLIKCKARLSTPPEKRKGRKVA